MYLFFLKYPLYTIYYRFKIFFRAIQYCTLAPYLKLQICLLQKRIILKDITKSISLHCKK